VVQKDASVDGVLHVLRGSDHVWVVDTIERRHLVGVITEKDFLEILAPPQIRGMVFGMPDIRSLGHGTVETAEEIMTHKVIYTERECKIMDVIEKMRSYKVRRLPVLDNGVLVGEITLNLLIKKYHDALNYIDITG
ncbi:MAG: CBS domain-containing protein, partial [Candidatus Thermoplasmatota archaeon]|nr:CBS domain-containing protein [Candidatus Thermoplasmatota archaeon]